jgi:hypothetical protein
MVIRTENLVQLKPTFPQHRRNRIQSSRRINMNRICLMHRVAMVTWAILIATASLIVAPSARAECCDVYIDVSSELNCIVDIAIVENLTNQTVWGMSYGPGSQDVAPVPCPGVYTALIGPNLVPVPFGASIPMWLTPTCCCLVRIAQDHPAAPCWVIHIEPC